VIDTFKDALQPGERFIWDDGPYEPWMLNKESSRDWPWGIKGASGFNCFGFRGAVFLPSKEVAQAVIDLHLERRKTQ
jgi:hypothetical protein